MSISACCTSFINSFYAYLLAECTEKTPGNKKRGKYSKSAILTSLEFHLYFHSYSFFLQHITSISAVYIQRGNVLPLRQLMPLSYRNNFLNSAHRVQNHYTPLLFPPAVSYNRINIPRLPRQV